MNWLFEKLTPWQKTLIASSLDTTCAFLAFPVAYFLRYGQAFPEVLNTHHVLTQALLLAVIQTFCFHFYGMYRSIWRYSSTPDLIRVIKGVSLASLLSFFAIFFYNRLEQTPRSIFMINWLLLITGLGGWRLLYRVVRDYSLASISGAFDRIVVIGAGSGGEQLIREIKRNPSLNMKVMALIDDDPGKRNKLLHGIPVMGGVDQIASVLEKTNATKVFIAIPRATGEQMRRIVEACKNSNVTFKTLPPIKDIINGRVSLELLRNIEPEDLLGRQQVSLDGQSIQQMIRNGSVMVTGAGGSIGSEICRQIAHFAPKELILFEQTEFSLYQLEHEFKKEFPEITYRCVIGDVRSRNDLDSVFQRFHPSVVFHAAAYKHVPMMEANPKAAIKTNIFGTQQVAEKSIQYNVKKFVMVSTDKAVNPTNIMGATKRVAEMICESLQSQTKTQFVIVRFGNVLGSSGSVIPRFKQQLKEGGPITITHPDIERYFMSIAEASQLVLQAGAIGKGSEIYVLNMGRPVKIVNLAKQLITLSGLRVDSDIRIEFIGLRPGEKLFEEVLFDDEKTLPTTHPMLRVAKARPTPEALETQLNSLRESLPDLNLIQLKVLLNDLVPEYNYVKDVQTIENLTDDKKVIPIH